MFQIFRENQMRTKPFSESLLHSTAVGVKDLNWLTLRRVMEPGTSAFLKARSQERKPNSRARVLETVRKKVAKVTRDYMSCGILEARG